MDAQRMAGQAMNFFVNNSTGEEILEGTVGGLMAGTGGLAAGNSWEQAGVQTGTAILGGIGLGMAGRNIGARLGKAMHPAALKKQQGLIATMGRAAGNKTTVEGFKQQGTVMKAAVQKGLIENSSSELLIKAASDPAGFFKEYGITAGEFERMLPAVKAGDMGAQALDALKGISPEQKEQFINQISGKFKLAEDAVRKHAVSTMDEGLLLVKRLAEEDPELIAEGAKQAGMDINMDNFRGGLEDMITGKTAPVTGEHVGRAIGRGVGDEIGVLGGMWAGSLLSAEMGLESAKDKQIRELQKQLNK